MSIYSEAVEGTKSEAAPKIWFTSDQHFGHHNIITYCNRPYKSVEEMAEDLIGRYNTLVAPEDIVYHLGDLSMNFKNAEAVMSRLNGIKHLIPGNHDLCHPANKKNRQYSAKDYKKLGFQSVELESIITLKLNGEDVSVKLCHLPYEPDAGEQADRRYMNMRPKDEGHLLLHGHVHNAWVCIPKKKMLNVGVDRHNYNPWSVQDIEEELFTAGYFDKPTTKE